MAERKNVKCEVDEQTLQLLKEQIEKIAYGTVTVVIHEGKIVQIEISEKVRLA